MDVVKKKDNKKKSIVGLISVLILLLMAYKYLTIFSDIEKIDKKSIVLGEVKIGDLNVTIDGYGVLRSSHQTLLTSPTLATVQEILIRPGKLVNPETTILKLSDPELIQRIKNAQLELSQRQAEYRRQKLEHRRERLTERTTTSELQSALEKITLEVSAQTRLIAEGIVSTIEHQQAILEQKDLSRRLAFQEQRFTQLLEIHKEAINITQGQVNQAQSTVDSLLLRQQKLIVKSGVQGVLQRLPIELGQSVNIGQELALIGSDRDLKALIRISQSQAQQIEIGQQAEIRTNTEQAMATVARIAPEVQDGTVEVELAFAEQVPQSARSEMNVDATITIKSIVNTLYISRPVNIQRHTNSELFVFSYQNEQATKQLIHFGEASGQFLQIMSGIGLGESLILSDMSRYNDLQTIKLVN